MVDVIENTFINNGQLFDFNAKYLKGKYYIELSRYKFNNSIALIAVDKTGFDRTTLTVCIEHFNPPPNVVLIKSWSNNEGVYEELIKLGIIKEYYLTVPTGYVFAYACELNI